MFSIGEFSRITSLSIKALRIYHDKELLLPAKIDDFTGYRYYTHRNVEKARIIVYLKNMEFSLDRIKDILTSYKDDAELVDILEEQRKVIETKINRYTGIVFSLNQLITKEKEYNMELENSDFIVEEKNVKTILLAGVRYKGKYSDCGPAFGKLGKHFGRYICGKPFNLYYDEDFKEDGADIETCFPIRKGSSVEDLDVRELTGGKCVSLIHKGSYDELSRSYEKITNYMNEKGYQMNLPIREIYIKGPGMIFRGNPKNYLTEIQIIIQ